MRYSRLFANTQHLNIKGKKSDAYRLLLQAGYIQSLGHGLVSYLPLGLRVINKIKQVISNEMLGLGGQEILAPLVNPRELWRRSGRDEIIPQELLRFEDRAGKQLVLAPTHEEAVVEMVRQGFEVADDLPVFLYQFQTKFRDEAFVKGGPLRSKEFLMKDGYSFHKHTSDLNNFFPKVFNAYLSIFKSFNIDVFPAEAGVGYMGGDKAYEFLMASEDGDDEILCCSECGYTANQAVAIAVREYCGSEIKDMEEMHTPGCPTLEQLENFLGLDPMHLARTYVYYTHKGLVMAVVRGDYEISLDKLNNQLKYPVIGVADRNQLIEAGMVPGYMSPLADLEHVQVVVDVAAANTANLVYGANKDGYHYLNVNYGRDFESSVVADIATVPEGLKCYHCGTPLQKMPAVELGNIFKLNKFYTKPMGFSYQDSRGRKVQPVMGAYGIGVSRVMAAVAEKNHDENGLIWPASISPYAAYLMMVGDSVKVERFVEQLYKELGDLVLYDDRQVSPGAKFKDADLLGLPYRILVTHHNLVHDVVEVKERATGKVWRIPSDRVVDFVKNNRIEHCSLN